jgi:TonB-dependent SusC/RagA subfamily outer membrane receptor
MEKNNKKHDGASYNYCVWRHSLSKFYLSIILLILLVGNANAQQNRVIKGKIVDEQQIPLMGASVLITGTTIRAISNIDGNFSIEVSDEKQTLTVTYLGMVTQVINVAGRNEINIVLKDDMSELSEVVVVGFGTQRKESMVAAITQTTGKVLERAGGVSSIGAALTGNVPGVVTTSSTGMPGEEDPQILIRGRSTWNNTSPLILVDGIERPMTSVDISSVESISVLKDASATAVFGVRGANGVIVITTK